MSKYFIKEINISKRLNFVTIIWNDGHCSNFHSKWLRFNCQCEICFRKVVGQQKINCSLFPEELLIENYEVLKDQDSLDIQFYGEIVKDHTTNLAIRWLRDLCYCDQCLNEMIKERKMHFISPGEVRELVPIDYSKVKDNKQGLFNVLEQIMKIGVCYVKGVPIEKPFLEEFARTVGPIVESTYGRVFSIQDTGSTEVVTNTREFLTFHSDQAHYESELGIQFFHCLEFDDCVEGGETVIADMFQCAEILRSESPDAFRILTKVPQTFATIDFTRRNKAFYEVRKPVIEVDYDDEVIAVHFNTGLDSTLRVHGNLVEAYFNAHRALWRIITRPELRFNHRMRPGDLLVFNNRRVAHGRNAFVPNGGMRLLQSTYVNAEDVRSKYMVLGHELDIKVTPTKIGNRSCV